MSKNLSIILSTYNEELFIEETLKYIVNTFPECEIIIVDDNSKDNTINIVKKLNIKNVKLFERKSRGLASAFLLGLINSSKEVIGWIDSNQGKLIKRYPAMIDQLDTNDMVIGYKEKRQDPIYRIYLAKIFNLLVRLYFKVPFNDIDCPLRLIRKTPMKKIFKQASIISQIIG